MIFIDAVVALGLIAICAITTLVFSGLWALGLDSRPETNYGLIAKMLYLLCFPVIGGASLITVIQFCFNLGNAYFGKNK